MIAVSVNACLFTCLHPVCLNEYFIILGKFTLEVFYALSSG